jgi:hypothetical protein
METNDIPAFTQIMIGLGELYDKLISETLIELYWVALKRFDIAAIRQAVSAHINNPDEGHIVPKPANIVRYLEGSAKTKALQAWSKVIHAIRRIGHHGILVFDDYLIHAVIHDMGGWVELCMMTEKETPLRAKEFEKRYEYYLLHKPVQYPKQLSELTNSVKAKLPVLIGDEQSALEVYLGGKDTYMLSQYKPLSLELLNQLESQRISS